MRALLPPAHCIHLCMRLAHFPPGVVLGALAGVALLSAVLLQLAKRTQHWRKGYQKAKLDIGAGRGRKDGVASGGVSVATAPVDGVRSAGNAARVGGGWGARVAGRDVSGDAFGVMPAPPGAGRGLA